MNINIVKLFLLTAVLSLSGCETIDLEQTENPSTLSQNFLDPVFTFNYVQLQLPDFVDQTNSFTQRVTRQMAMTGGNSYDNAFTPTSFDRQWSTAYTMLNAIKIMEPKAVEKNQLYILGASKVIRAYVLMTLVDMYGDVPYTQALQGNANLTPVYDSSASVYTGILAELDSAIATLQVPSPQLGTGFKDLYYTSEASWITLARTLKLKMYNNARLAGTDIGVDIGLAITGIYTAGDYIDTPAEDFKFQYGNSRNSPNTRHPMYNDQYELGGGAYIGNYIMWAMTTEKKNPGGVSLTDALDPRTNFYFFKQHANPGAFNLDTFTLPGRSRPVHYNDDQYASFYDSSVHTPYVVSNWVGGTSVAANGFWGRDHGDNSGIPPDAEKRTVGGMYPAGGAYGTPTSVQTSGVLGAKGEGIMPIVMSSYVHFILAEASLTVTGFTDLTRAAGEFNTGMAQSITTSTKKIGNYPVRTPAAETAFQTQLNADTAAYLSFMNGKYNAPGATPQQKLEMVIKEYYIAAWGNGIEPYNNYRRTGYPSNFQPTLQPSPGPFYSTALYSASSVNNNPNTPSNVRTRKVFWDKAAVVLH